MDILRQRHINSLERLIELTIEEKWDAIAKGNMQAQKSFNHTLRNLKRELHLELIG